MAILVDTNIRFAAGLAKDARHKIAREFILSLQNETAIVSAPVLNELFYLAVDRINYNYAIVLFSTARESFQIEALTSADMRRMEQIMIRYASAEFDFTDTAIMAQAERLNVTRVATFDRRDFALFRPSHCEYLELLPN